MISTKTNEMASKATRKNRVALPTTKIRRTQIVKWPGADVGSASR